MQDLQCVHYMWQFNKKNKGQQRILSSQLFFCKLLFSCKYCTYFANLISALLHRSPCKGPAILSTVLTAFQQIVQFILHTEHSQFTLPIDNCTLHILHTKNCTLDTAHYKQNPAHHLCAEFPGLSEEHNGEHMSRCTFFTVCQQI